MTIELPKLPYPHDALEPVISGVTLKTHHGKHHRGYVDKLNALVRGTDLAGCTLETIVQRTAWCGRTDRALSAVFDNAAQALNHSFYWRSLRPKGGRGPQGRFARHIRSQFGSQDTLLDALKSAATGHFGSGWAWLVLDGSVLKVVTTENAGTPIVHGQSPLLVVDVWEHAYYLDYRELRSAHVAAVVEQLLDWEFAEANFERSGGAAADGARRTAGLGPETAAIEREAS